MAIIVLINGVPFNAANPDDVARAKYIYKVDIDQAGNVTAESLNGMAISTPGSISAASSYQANRSTNVALGNNVGGGLVQGVVSINGSTVNGVVMGIHGPRPTTPATVSAVLPIIRRFFNTYVADVDWAGCSLTKLNTVFDQLWKVHAPVDTKVALLVREILVSAGAGDCPIAYYASELDKVAAKLAGARLWDVANPVPNTILSLNDLLPTS